MSKLVLFFADRCPDTAPFVAELETLKLEYEAVEITASMANLKRFLHLRDTHHAFEKAKQNGYIGIPALVIEDKVILDIPSLNATFGK